MTSKSLALLGFALSVAGAAYLLAAPLITTGRTAEGVVRRSAWAVGDGFTIVYATAGIVLAAAALTGALAGHRAGRALHVGGACGLGALSWLCLLATFGYVPFSVVFVPSAAMMLWSCLRPTSSRIHPDRVREDTL